MNGILVICTTLKKMQRKVGNEKKWLKEDSSNYRKRDSIECTALDKAR